MEEAYQNFGSWNITDFHILVGAAHSPGLDPLMVAYREAEKAVQEDEARVRRLVKPWLADEHHLRLKNAANKAKGAALDYLLDHPDLLIIQRKLG